MIETRDALVYGLVQGLTEFLPISSSGHLALIPKVLGIEDPGVVFDLAMHVGTALSVLLYFNKDVLEIIKTLSFQKVKNHSGRFFSQNSIIATLASIVCILALRGFAQEFARQIPMIAFQLAFFGILMAVVDYKFKDEPSELMSAKIDFKRSLAIGIAQALAIFPGVSRSGVTLTIARSMGLSRYEATRFSFLLSLPIILGGFIIKLPEVYASESFEIGILLLGIITSFLIGLATIHFFLKFISRIGLVYFGIYRVIIAILLIV